MKVLKKGKWYFAVAFVFLILLVGFILFDVQDKSFYKRVFNWFYEEKKQYRKSVLKAKQREDFDKKKKIEEVNRELQSIDGKKKQALDEIDDMSTVKAGEMFKKMGY
jgi:thiosulfate reductase cytochrome b subunit